MTEAEFNQLAQAGFNRIPLVLVDQDRTRSSRELVERDAVAKARPAFRMRGVRRSTRALRRAGVEA